MLRPLRRSFGRKVSLRITLAKWHLAERTTGPVPAENRGGFLDFWQASNVLEFSSHPYEGGFYDREGKPIHFAGIYRIDFMTQLAVDFLNKRGKERLLARMKEAGDNDAEIQPPFFPYS